MPAAKTQQTVAFQICQELRRHRAAGFLPRISADSGRVIVWTGRGADHLVVEEDGSVRPSREDCEGCEAFPVEWV